jgi:hypothetical protein
MRTDLAAATPRRALRVPRLRRLALFVLTFLAVVPMQITLGGTTIGVALLVLGVLALARFARMLFEPRIPRLELQWLLLVAVLGLVFLLGSLRVAAQDLSMPINCLYGIVIFAGAMTLARSYARLYGPGFVDAALLALFLVGLLQSLVQIGVLVSEPLSQWVYGLVALSEDSRTHIEQGYRSPGLFSSGAAVLGTFNALVLAIGLTATLRPSLSPTWRRIAWVALATLLQIAAIAVSGRTGFVVLALYLALLAGRGLLRARPALAGWNLLWIGAILIGLALAFVAWIGIEAIEDNLRWSFEFVYSLLEGQGLKTESTSVLFGDMFFLPESFAGLLLGSGSFGRSPNLVYIDSDAGYILMIFGGGVLGTALAMSVFGLVLRHARRLRRVHPPLAFLLGFLVLAVVIINMKDFYFLQNSGVTQLILFCYALLLTAAIRHEPRH